MAIAMERWMRRACAAAILLLGPVFLSPGLLPTPASAADAAGAAEREARTLHVPASKTTLRLAIPTPVGFAPDRAKALRLAEVDRPEASLPVDRLPATASDGVVANDRFLLSVAVPPRSDAPAMRRFRLQTDDASPAPPTNPWSFRETDAGGLGLWEGKRPVFVYRHGMTSGPKLPGGRAVPARACYFHPIYGLDGEIVSDDFPADHYHHRGLFWAWPHVRIDGRSYDLWIVNDAIRQRFVRWLGRETTPDAAVLGIENGWFVGDAKVMTERVWMRVFPADASRWLEVELTLTAGDRAVTLQGAEHKGYGGLALRFAPRRQTLLSSPDGSMRADLAAERLRWADITAQFSGAPGRSGAALFVPAGHPGYPPVWTARHYGALCVGWPGEQDATLAPGQSVRLGYRVWIHREATFPQLQTAYEAVLQAERAGWKSIGLE